ncbi:MAG TPA: type II toxin-antitoxin system VapC family toxin [Mycobacteriales bacterium]|nr:type II toxin-antitoxin system VapC family toxin [Mycobacteriales bacterium]
MIYLDACALLKFVKPEKESVALRAWRQELARRSELVTSELAQLEIARTLLRSGVDHQRVPYVTEQALSGIYLADLSSTVLARARAYRTPRLGSLDAIHLASAEAFRDELTDFVTYDRELVEAATELGLPVAAPT